MLVARYWSHLPRQVRSVILALPLLALEFGLLFVLYPDSPGVLMRHWPLVPLLVFLVFAGLAFIAAEMILLIPVVDLPSPSPVVAYGASVGVGFGITAGSGASSGIALNFLLLTKPYPDAFVIHHFVLAAVLFTLGALATLYDWWTHVRIPATPSARAAATETENRAQLFRHQARARARLRAALRRAPWLRAVAWALGIALPLADVAALGILLLAPPDEGRALAAFLLAASTTVAWMGIPMWFGREPRMRARRAPRQRDAHASGGEAYPQSE